MDQLTSAMTHLQNGFSDDIIYAGDFNWINEEEMTLDDHWEDIWIKLNPRESGYTYDTIKNEMIKGMPVPPARLDRILCRCHHLVPDQIKLVGNNWIKDKYVKIRSLKGHIYVKKVFIYQMLINSNISI